MIDAEHCFKQMLVHAAKKSLELCGGHDCIVIRATQGVGASLSANDFQDGSVAVPNLGTYPQLLIRVQEIVGAAHGDAEKKLPQGPQGGTFTGFVRAIKDVKPF